MPKQYHPPEFKLEAANLMLLDELINDLGVKTLRALEEALSNVCLGRFHSGI